MQKTGTNGIQDKTALVMKVIHCKSCNNLQCDHANKLYKHKVESLPNNETHKIHWGFKIQTDQGKPTRRPDLLLINKKAVKTDKKTRPSVN